MVKQSIWEEFAGWEFVFIQPHQGTTKGQIRQHARDRNFFVKTWFGLLARIKVRFYQILQELNYARRIWRQTILLIGTLKIFEWIFPSKFTEVSVPAAGAKTPPQDFDYSLLDLWLKYFSKKNIEGNKLFF